MKKYFLLIVVFLFSCTSEIESPDSILERRPLYYEVFDEDFASCLLEPWEARYGDLELGSHGNIKLQGNLPAGCDAIFSPNGKENNDWDLQLRRKVDIKYGYRYTLQLGGNTTKEGEAPLVLALLCKEGKCEDYKKWEQTLSKSYNNYTLTEAWDNCSVTDPNTIFVISGGKPNVNEFKIAWIGMWAEFINCP